MTDTAYALIAVIGLGTLSLLVNLICGAYQRAHAQLTFKGTDFEISGKGDGVHVAAAYMQQVMNVAHKG